MKLHNLTFNYVKHKYNETWKNERHIEVPIGMYFLNKFNFDCIEVGAVMPHYGYVSKLVIDPFDDFEGCLKLNALDYSYTNENVLSISTIEHFKTDEKNRTDYDSVIFLNKILQEAKNYLITWPVGYNKILDDYIKTSNISNIILKRLNVENEWELDPDNKHLEYIYNRPNSIITSGFMYANAICIITNLTEFHS